MLTAGLWKALLLSSLLCKSTTSVVTIKWLKLAVLITSTSQNSSSSTNPISPVMRALNISGLCAVYYVGAQLYKPESQRDMVIL